MEDWDCRRADWDQFHESDWSYYKDQPTCPQIVYSMVGGDGLIKIGKTGTSNDWWKTESVTDSDGYLHFSLSWDSDIVSNHVKNRLANIRHANPAASLLTVAIHSPTNAEVASGNEPVSLELDLHRRHKGSRVGGEWFSPHPRLVLDIFRSHPACVRLNDSIYSHIPGHPVVFILDAQDGESSYEMGSPDVIRSLLYWTKKGVSGLDLEKESCRRMFIPLDHLPTEEEILSIAGERKRGPFFETVKCSASAAMWQRLIDSHSEGDRECDGG